MRIVIVTHAYPRRAGDGAGAFLARLASALVARGHAVAVVAPADRGSAARFTLDGVDVVQVRYAAAVRENLAYTGGMADAARSPSGLWAFWSLIRSLRDGARREAGRLRADVVHAHWWIPSGWAVVGSACPVVVSLHGSDVRLLRGVLPRLAARRVFSGAHAVTAVSSFLAAEARRLTWRRDLPIDIVPLPIAAQAFHRTSAGGGGIAVLGRLTHQKRVDLVLRAVRAAGLDVAVTIVGDGPARAGLEALVLELELARVRFTGAVPPDQVPAAVGDADVLAFPSQAEGLGLAAAEALLLGIPVVAASDGGGILDVIRDGAWGRVVPPTPEALGSALRVFLGNVAARDAARREGERLKAALAPDAIARRFEEIYARCA